MSSYPATSADDTQLAATAVSGNGRAPTSVHIRMYRALAPDTGAEDKSYKGLLGDCFLIRLEAGDTKSHILIDCGLLLGSPNAAPRAKQIAEDIAKTCSRCLDLLVVTHEHWDHISGFSQASEIFFDEEKLRIKNLWMAWTEDPNDPDAQALRAKFDKSGQAFAMIAEKLKNSPIIGLDAARALNGLEGFLGVAGKGRRLVGRDILDKLKKQAITQPPSYLAPVKPDRNARPDNVLQTPGAVTLRAYVLGPPRDWKWLSKDKPSTDPARQETYLETPSLGNACSAMQMAMMYSSQPNLPSPRSIAAASSRTLRSLHLDSCRRTMAIRSGLESAIFSRIYGSKGLMPASLARREGRGSQGETGYRRSSAYRWRLASIGGCACTQARQRHQ
jgi:hypothetical protein